MKRIFEDNSFAIGRTPLVKLNRLTPDRGVTILAKIEGRNPGYSVKCRIGAAMVWDAERRGVLRPGMTIVEPTSGNTGIALAFVGAARGYRVVVTMPEDSSRERRKLIEAFGARVVLTDAAADMQGAVAKAMEIAESNPKRNFLPQQFNNPVNPAIHEQTTGPEIWRDTGGEVGAVVAGVGTGGTITGICRYLKSKSRKTILGVAVEPEESPVLRQKLQGKEIRPGRHTIAGIGAGFIPQVLDFSLLDRVEQVRSDEADEYARRLAQEEGILSGPSSGAAVAVAVRLAREEEFAGKTIVVILPDSGERYLSTSLFKKSARPRRR